MTTIGIILIIILVLSFIVSICIEFEIGIYKRRHSKTCTMEVTSSKTGYKYPVFRYYISKDDNMELLIYNRFTERNEWKLIYHFDNPFLVAYAIDRDYAMSHMAQLFMVKTDKKFTEGIK